MKILIVEDQRGFRRIYQDALASRGYETLTAEDGLKGWEMSREAKPDLVLLDLGLPKMNGFEVLEKLRADEATRTLPVIVFSVTGEPKDIEKAMGLGATDYAVKGFVTMAELTDKIKALAGAAA